MGLDSGAIRPLLQRLPMRRSDALVFAVGDREVTVAGDPDAAWEILWRCDGTGTVVELEEELAELGGDARELIERLLGEGVLVDCSRAYELAHEQASASSGMFRPADPEVLGELAATPVRPASLGSESVPLPDPPARLADLLAGRRSAAADDPRAVSPAELGAIVSATSSRRGPRAATPSAGDLRPLMVQVVIRRALGEARPGVWWFDPDGGELRLVGTEVPALDELLLSPGPVESLLGAGEPVVVISADAARMARKYSNRGYRYSLLEAGAAMQNAYLAASELGVPIRAVGGFDDHELARALSLAPGVLPLLALTLGA